MKNQPSLTLTFVWITICVLANGTIAAVEPPHPYHVSMAEVNWNPESQKFEVALCLWPADLEKALAQQAGRPIDLAKEPKLDGLMEAYIAKRFKIHSTPRTTNQTQHQKSATGLASVNSTDSDAGVVKSEIAVKESSVPVVSPTPTIQTVVITPAAAPHDNDSPPESQIKWFGHEANDKQAWLYFEVSGVPGADWSVENRVFFELNDDQLNHVQWKGTGETEILVCNAESAKISLGKK